MTTLAATDKLYYRQPNLFAFETHITALHEDQIELATSLAYPEGGGQESDQGYLVTATGVNLRFIHAGKFFTTKPHLVDFPDIQIGGVIRHKIHPADCDKLNLLKLGDRVTIHIDPQRRYELSLSHTASHLLYVAILKLRPHLEEQLLGCHIKIGSSRFDFFTEENFSAEELTVIAATASELSAQALPITIESHQIYPDARVWRMGEAQIPCGGTHLNNSLPVGPMQVKRKSLGANKERIMAGYSNPMTIDQGLPYLSFPA